MPPQRSAVILAWGRLKVFDFRTLPQGVENIGEHAKFHQATVA